MIMVYCCFLWTALLGQNPGLAPASSATISPTDVPWPVQLGARSLHRSNSIPVVDQVVLVPDTDTYLDEIARWTPQGQWPVLIEDDVLAPMFVRRFNPTNVYRRPPVQTPTVSLIKRLHITLAQTWGARPGESYHDALKRHGVVPLGLVLTSVSSKSWPAAIALAAGRGQAMSMLDGSFGGGGTILSAAKSKTLAELVRQRARQTGLPWQAMGDQLDAITICRNLPARVRYNWPRGAGVQIPQAKPDDPLAITDVLGRRENGDRFAVVGWINGSEPQSAYVAMCSLFLKAKTAWLCNGYANDGQWAKYAMDEAASILAKAGFECSVIDNATMSRVRRISSGGLEWDLLLINSKGNKDFFVLGNSQGTPDDVPVLSVPAALQMIHSWSLEDPSNANTVGGRWIEHGVYAYVGSSQEPFLAAFVPPVDVAMRLTSLVPFLAAGRWWGDQSPLARAWRINTLGDPLMTMGPPALNTKPRIPKAVGGEDVTKRGLNLKAEAERLMRSLAKDPTSSRLTLTLQALVQLGNDDMAREMWIWGNQHDLNTAATNSIALGPLFRLQDRNEFAEAFPLVKSPSRLQRDMLWQLLGSSLNDSSSDDVVLLLASHVSGRTPSGMIEQLAPVLSKRFGSGRVISLINRALGKGVSGAQRQQLQRLLKQYGGASR